MLNMAIAVRISLIILYSLNAIGFIRAVSTESSDPPFKAPEIRDPALGNWFYVNTTKHTNIGLKEEVPYAVLIAEINYTVEEKPGIGSFTSPNNNYLLGADIKQDESGKWGIYITKKQDYETEIMRQYIFEIVIGNSNFGITLNILNIDDNAPVIQPNDRNCAVEENYSGLTNCSYTVHDADGWIDQVKVTFKSMPNEGSDYFDFHLIPVNGIDKDYSVIAYLNVIQSLDYEILTLYMLTMTARDGAGNALSLVTPVEVTDMPDELPKWMRLTSSETIEEKSIKTLTVLAIDGDIHINAEINYKIVPAKGEETLFTMEGTTGNITIHEIDRDTLKKEIFRFQIIAYEKENISSTIEATIIVIVEDINDHIPEISPDKLSIDIEEETYMTLNFPQPILISDIDLAGNAQYYVSLIDDSDYHWSSAFLIIPNSGYQTNNFSISVVNASLLDYENEYWRHMMIKIRAIEVANNSHIDEKIIEIRLINWNDELPIFTNESIEVFVPEDVEMGYHIATIFATDRDINDTVTHSLMAQEVLKINETTGVIVTSRNDAFDFESIPFIVVQIVATDLALHKTYASLSINIIDVNDVPPTLNLPRFTPSLVEEVDIGTAVDTEIEATDKDTAAKLVFSIDWNLTTARKTGVIVDQTFYRNHLTMNTTYPTNDTRFAKGVLIVTGRIDYEAFDVIYISVVVTDITTVHNDNSTSASILLNITDINDNAPIFDSYEPMSISENQLGGALIGAITATDADGTLYNQISYYIEPTNNTAMDLVQMNNKTGVIKVDKDRAIDAEIYEFIYFKVNATDGQHNSTISLAIYVIDMNDEVPYLLTDKFDATIHIPEKSPSGKEIVRIFGRDNDRTHPYNNVSYLINANYSASLQYFNLRRFDGVLKVNLVDGHILDRDFGSANYTLNLKLRDNYLDDGITWNTNSLDTVVTVILDDINDQIPKLPNRSNPLIEISEITNAGVLIETVTAEDHDDPDTNNTKVHYEILNVSFIADEIAHEPPTKCENLFEVKTVDAKHAQIYTTQALGGCYGTWATELYVQDRGTNPGPLNDTKTYHIQITDYNYNAPIIVFPIQGKNIALTQDQLLHTQLKTYDMQPLNDFNATDDDSGASGQVRLSISSENNDDKYFELMSTHANSAKLQLRSWPDFDQQNRFQLIVTAADGGTPMKNVSQDVTIVFVSSPDPEFHASEWEISVKENKTGLAFSTLVPEARDNINENGGNIDIYYFIDQKGDYEFFNLDNFTRNLTVVKELDREKQESMQILVIATADRNGPPREPKKKATLNTTIIVLDENDNAPSFEMNFYSAGVAVGDRVDNIIMTVKATDPDLNDTLTYSIIVGSMVTSDSSLAEIENPFNLINDTGELLLRFSATSDMEGYFSFRILVRDAVNHSDTTKIQVYIVSQTNRVTFTFKNSPAYVNAQRMFVAKSFSDTFGYTCNVDDIKSSVDSDDRVLDNTTSLMSHFIDLRNNLPIASDVIILASSDLQTVTSLKASLQTRSIYLIDVPTGTASVTENIQQTIQWVLICLIIFFSLSCVALIVAYYMRSKSLLERLDKMALENEFGPQHSGLARASVAPTTNQFAVAGSNPIWRTTKESINTTDDVVSLTSGDSDLMGIENNSNFHYSNDEIDRKDETNYKEGEVEQNGVGKIIFHNPRFKEGKYSGDEDTC